MCYSKRQNDLFKIAFIFVYFFIKFLNRQAVNKKKEQSYFQKIREIAPSTRKLAGALRSISYEITCDIY